MRAVGRAILGLALAARRGRRLQFQHHERAPGRAVLDRPGVVVGPVGVVELADVERAAAHAVPAALEQRRGRRSLRHRHDAAAGGGLPAQRVERLLERAAQRGGQRAGRTSRRAAAQVPAACRPGLTRSTGVHVPQQPDALHQQAAARPDLDLLPGQRPALRAGVGAGPRDRPRPAVPPASAADRDQPTRRPRRPASSSSRPTACPACGPGTPPTPAGSTARPSGAPRCGS